MSDFMRFPGGNKEKYFEIFKKNIPRNVEEKYFQVEAAFSRFDISGDDQLDYKEFCSMMNAR